MLLIILIDGRALHHGVDALFADHARGVQLARGGDQGLDDVCC